MNVHLRIDDNRTFSLTQAVLLYQEGNRALCYVARGKVPAESGALLMCWAICHDRVS
jgi:hypothetical protein